MPILILVSDSVNTDIIPNTDTSMYANTCTHTRITRTNINIAVNIRTNADTSIWYSYWKIVATNNNIKGNTNTNINTNANTRTHASTSTDTEIILIATPILIPTLIACSKLLKTRK